MNNKVILILFAILSIFGIAFLTNSISNILLPFIVGIILAYFLDPIVQKLEKKGFNRVTATLLVLLFFTSFITIFIYSFGPILYHQLIAFISNIPNYLAILNDSIQPHINTIYSKFGHNVTENQNLFLKEVSEYSLKISKNIVTNIWNSSIALINLLSLVVITPIVTFYLLRDWKILLNNLISYIPKKHVKEVTTQFTNIDNVLSAYIRGQTNVCLILGIFYASALSLLDLNSGFLIGFLTGIFAFIPYFGVFIGMFIAIVISFLQYDNYLMTMLVIAIFLIGQFIEGNFITPKLVGKKVGIHPVLIIFALLAGASLFGFLGILFAIPFIAVLGVIARFAASKYLKSNLYLSKEKI